MNEMTDLSREIERSTQGIRDVMFADIARFRRGEVPAGYLHELKAGFSPILSSVDKDLTALKIMSDHRRGNDMPQAIANLNLNLMLGGTVTPTLTDETASTPAAKSIAQPKGPQTTFIGGKSPTLPAP